MLTALAAPAGLVVGMAPLQAVDSNLIADVPVPVRAAIAIGTVLVLGGVACWRYGGFIDRSIDASTDRPLTSMGYGLVTHAVIAFGGLYIADQLGQLVVAGWNPSVLGVLSGLAIWLVIGALGFTVVGSAVVALGGSRRRWAGLLAGALLAGVAAVVDPIVGGLVWLTVVSTGIGGPVRQWVTATWVDDV